MKSAAMTSNQASIDLVILVSLSPATLFMVESTCDRAQTMTWSDACLKACNTTSLYNLCGETLQGAPDTAELTVYALVAADLAKRSYETTAAAAERLIWNASVPVDEQAAYKFCVGQYDVARKSMDGVVNDMYGCVFHRTLWYYVDCDSALWKCEDALSTLKDSPLVKMNAADRDAAALARALGSLIVGR